jgi:hypothetical protein
VTIKVVTVDFYPEELIELIKENSILLPLFNQNSSKGDHFFNSIPRHHPELVRIAEEFINHPDNSEDYYLRVESSEGSRYLITSDEHGEEVYFEGSFIDATLPLDLEVLRMAPDDFSEPDWKAFEGVEWGKRSLDWKYYVSDNVKAIWGTFTETQKATLSTQFEEIHGEALDRQPT